MCMDLDHVRFQSVWCPCTRMGYLASEKTDDSEWSCTCDVKTSAFLVVTFDASWGLPCRVQAWIRVWIGVEEVGMKMWMWVRLWVRVWVPNRFV